jgi:hypothetical protein
MPWKECDAMELRTEFCLRALERDMPPEVLYVRIALGTARASWVVWVSVNGVSIGKQRLMAPVPTTPLRCQSVTPMAWHCKRRKPAENPPGETACSATLSLVCHRHHAKWPSAAATSTSGWHPHAVSSEADWSALAVTG